MGTKIETPADAAAMIRAALSEEQMEERRLRC